MATGTVKWFNDAKGFGFIEPDGGGPDVFAHFTAIVMEGFKTLKQGARVNYELSDGPKGPLALNISSSDDSSGDAPPRVGLERRPSRVRAPQFHANTASVVTANK